MAAVPIDPPQISVHPELLDTHGTHVANATDVSRTFGARHAGYVAECAEAWAGSSAAALAELSAHWETTDTRVHGRIGGFSDAIRDGGRRWTATEETRAFQFRTLRKKTTAT